MILDSSAVVALVFQEPGYETLLEKLRGAAVLGIGAPTATETAIVLSTRLERDACGVVARLLQETGIVLIPFGEAHYSVAVDAWLRFGRGRHPAALNLGDWFAYAVAKLAGQPLLCVGDNFAQTDLDLA